MHLSIFDEIDIDNNNCLNSKAVNDHANPFLLDPFMNSLSEKTGSILMGDHLRCKMCVAHYYFLFH
jgi:hypothetical protein